MVKFLKLILELQRGIDKRENQDDGMIYQFPAVEIMEILWLLLLDQGKEIPKFVIRRSI
jgi:hypothetical protein